MGHDGVEVHAAAVFRQLHGDDLLGLTVLEQAAGQMLHPLRRGALGHADEHGATADDQDVAPFDGGVVVVALLVTEVLDELLTGKLRVPAVDGLHVVGLATTGGLGHGVDGDAAIDPAGGVAGEEVVGQRFDDEIGRGMHADHHVDAAVGHLGVGEAAGEDAGQLAVRHVRQEAAHVVGQGSAEAIVGDLVLQQPGFGFRHVQGFRQQIGQEEDFDILIAQYLSEFVVLLTGTFHRQDVVKQQILAVGRGQTLQTEVGAVQHDTAQLANFRTYIKFAHDDIPSSSGPCE